MRPARICVLGGTGFVGAQLVTRLVREGHRVKVLTRNREAHRDLLVLPDLDLVNADVHDPGQLASQFGGFDVSFSAKNHVASKFVELSMITGDGRIRV